MLVPVALALTFPKYYAGLPTGKNLIVWPAVVGPEPYFKLSERDLLEVLPDGSNSWRNESTGCHRSLVEVADDANIGDVIDRLIGCP